MVSNRLKTISIAMERTEGVEEFISHKRNEKLAERSDTQTKDLRYTELDIQLVMNITSDFFRVILINFTIERERSYKKNFPQNTEN